ncbi:DUF6119 family protein [Saccharothrix sp. HUAS TT1]|uniref:DUF6119 family protein n=1 Tax=unclassified Saccharothrix TaxID=2593673 RepID=UPI00345C3BDD
MSAADSESSEVADTAASDAKVNTTSTSTRRNIKRSNNAIWKIVVADGETPKGRLDEVIKAYEMALITEGSTKQSLVLVPLRQSESKIKLELYVRPNFGVGLLPFVEDYLMQPEDTKRFAVQGVDACLFISTDSSLYAITSGGGHHIIADFVDYSFPFDMAKRLISNNFTAADVRDMTGSRTSRAETYRHTYSIDKSEAMDTIWKKLVGRLDAERLPEGSPLRGFINPERPPAVEIKSAFVLRQKLGLSDVCELVKALESLPEPTPEHLKELSFLDNLYPIKNDKDLTCSLCEEFVENVRLALLVDEVPDVDVLDPYEIISFKAASEFKLGRDRIGDSPPTIDELLPVLKNRLCRFLENRKDFYDHFITLTLSYRVDPDDKSKVIRRKLFEYLHGQVDFEGKTYFRIDKVWYRSFGDFLENLKRDFIAEVFSRERPVLLGPDVEFLPWAGGSERDFNIAQAKENDFYFGDEIFAKVDRGKVELFDLLKVDDENRKLYIIHVKKEFAAKMRDACSQITVSADVISKDREQGKDVLINYYRNEWSKNELNAGVSEDAFLSWFDYDLIYVVLCSTRNTFVAEDFQENRLTSHIARREILATKNEMKRNRYDFRLAHTKYSTSKGA